MRCSLRNSDHGSHDRVRSSDQLRVFRLGAHLGLGRRTLQYLTRVFAGAYAPEDPPVPATINWILDDAGDWEYALYDNDNAQVWVLSVGVDYTLDVPHGGTTLRVHTYRPEEVIPTLSEWGLVVMFLLLLLTGTKIIKGKPDGRRAARA